MDARRTRIVAVALPVGLGLALALTAFACSKNPSLDGSTVPTIGSPDAPPSCADACNRLERLCGYAPVGCTDTCSSDAEPYDSPHLLCIGQAKSCREALNDCANADGGATDEDAGEDGGETADDADAGPDDAQADADADDAG